MMQKLVIELVEPKLAIVVVKRQVALGAVDGNAAKTKVVAVADE